MGRSVAQFFLPVAKDWVLQAASAYGFETGMTVEDASPNHLTLTAGNALLWAKNYLRVWAYDAPGGAQVTVEMWFETALIKEMNANPYTFLGMIPRRQAWKIAARFVERLGVDPNAVFQHS